MRRTTGPPTSKLRSPQNDIARQDGLQQGWQDQQRIVGARPDGRQRGWQERRRIVGARPDGRQRGWQERRRIVGARLDGRFATVSKETANDANAVAQLPDSIPRKAQHRCDVRTILVID